MSHWICLYGFWWHFPHSFNGTFKNLIPNIMLSNAQPCKEGAHATNKYVLAGMHIHLEASQTPIAVLSKTGSVQVSHAPNCTIFLFVNKLNICGCFIDFEILFLCSWSKSETFHDRMQCVSPACNGRMFHMPSSSTWTTEFAYMVFGDICAIHTIGHVKISFLMLHFLIDM